MRGKQGTGESAAEPPPVAPLEPRSLRRVREFDGLRGVILIIVFVAHMNVFLPIPRLLVVPGATVSLNTFFVLSGFLITTLLLNEQLRRGRIGIGGFYGRRVVRLFPALYIVVLATALFAAATHTWAPTEKASIISVVFYYANFYSASAPLVFTPRLASGFQHLWSLSFEEQFYLIWPWVTIAALTIRTRLRTVVIVLLSAIAIIGIHRGLSYESGTPFWSLFVRTDTRADSLLWGCLLAHLWVRRKEPIRFVNIAAWIAAAFLIVCLPLAQQKGPFLYLGGFDLIDLACITIVLAILNASWNGNTFFRFRPLIALGVVSYGFYLWHLPVFFAIRYYDGHWSYAVRVIVATVVTLALTLASWFLVERPLARWRQRREKERRVPKDPAPGGATLEPLTS